MRTGRRLVRHRFGCLFKQHRPAGFCNSKALPVIQRQIRWESSLTL